MKRILIAGLCAGALLILAACSSTTRTGHANSTPTSATSGDTSMSAGMSMPGSSAHSMSGATPASGPHNAADITFTTDMIPHHGQATQMADMALAKTSNAGIKQLATNIKNAQNPEIQLMSGWLTGWGQPVPSTTMGAMGSSMPGMMSDADMTKLDQTTGTAFDRLWVTMMVTHHTGAIAMATTELASGENADAKKLAQSIITSQGTEITTMKQLLTTLPS
jgi:uncharacterized protein (DUF305 family)